MYQLSIRILTYYYTLIKLYDVFFLLKILFGHPSYWSMLQTQIGSKANHKNISAAAVAKLQREAK